MGHSLSNLITVRDFVRFAITQMQIHECHFGHGSSNAYDEAIFMVLASLKLPLDNIEPFWDARLEPDEIASISALIEKRCAQKLPAAYLLGVSWLGGYEFIADQRALVPRSLLVNALDQLLENSENQEWPNLDSLLETAEQSAKSVQILDLCTGGGSIAVVAAYRLNAIGIRAQFIASDIDADALALAQENIRKHKLEQSISTTQSDLFSSFKSKQKFDLILCNPPYVNAASVKALPQEFLHEPVIALGSGPDGMDFISKLLSQLPSRLNLGGSLLLEIGHEYQHFEAMMSNLAEQGQAPFEYQYIDVPAGENMVVMLTCSA